MTIQNILKELKESWHAKEGVASVDAFDPMEDRVQAPLPADYKFFMMWSDGGEGNLPKGYLALYSLGELAGQQVPEMKDFIIFGGEGDHVFAFDARKHRTTADYEVVEFSLASRDVDEVEPIARDFSTFLRGKLG